MTCVVTCAGFLVNVSTCVVPYNVVYPSHVLYWYVEHFVIFVVCLCANAMWIITIVPCTSKHKNMNDRHSHVRWSHARHTLDELYYLYLLVGDIRAFTTVAGNSTIDNITFTITPCSSCLYSASLLIVFRDANTSKVVSATCRNVYMHTADFLDASRCFLAASAVHGTVHGGHSWFHHYSVLYQDSLFNVQYFSTCDIFEFVCRYPRGCVPVSSLLHTINRCKWAISYRHIGSFMGKHLYRVIFVIYAHDCILPDNIASRWKYSRLFCDQESGNAIE